RDGEVRARLEARDAAYLVAAQHGPRKAVRVCEGLKRVGVRGDEDVASVEGRRAVVVAAFEGVFRVVVEAARVGQDFRPGVAEGGARAARALGREELQPVVVRRGVGEAHADGGVALVGGQGGRVNARGGRERG